MSTMDMAHWESRRNNEFVESVTYVAYEHIRHNTLFNIIYIMRTFLWRLGGRWWSDLKPDPLHWSWKFIVTRSMPKI